MEVKLDKRYPVAASPEQAWQVLSDIRATAACMPGAQITEQIDDTHFKGTVKSKVGPAVMMFNGDIELLGLDPAAKQLKILGKGADKSGSSASMNLVAHIEAGDAPDSAVLVGQATILVSGKLAQFGSRLLVPVSDAMLGQFAGNFNKAASAVAGAEVLPSPALGAIVSVSTAARVDASPAPPQPQPQSRNSPAPANELNALALMWTVVKGWWAGLFRKPR